MRLSTHASFKDFVKSSGIEFYPLGGDSKVLAACTSLPISNSACGCFHFVPGLRFNFGKIVEIIFYNAVYGIRLLLVLRCEEFMLFCIAYTSVILLATLRVLN